MPGYGYRPLDVVNDFHRCCCFTVVYSSVFGLPYLRWVFRQCGEVRVYMT